MQQVKERNLVEVMQYATGRAGVALSVFANLDGVHDDLKTLDGKTPALPETVTVQVPEYKERKHL